MKRMILLVCVLLMIAGCVVLYYYAVGEPIDGIQLEYNVEEKGNTILLDICAKESGVALDHMKLNQEGNTLCINLRKLPVSVICSETKISTSVDITLLTDIYLGGRRIWTKSE